MSTAHTSNTHAEDARDVFIYAQNLVVDEKNG